MRASSLPTSLFVSPTASKKVGEGKFFLAGTGKLTLSVAGNLRVVVQNPAGSGKKLNIVRVAGFATATGWATLLLNPTTGVPVTAARPVLNAVVGGGMASVAKLRDDTDTTVPLGGGTDTGLVIAFPGGHRVMLDMPPLVIAPGVTLGINVPFAGAADAAMSIYWFEE